jgi:hypothetical protein
MADRGAKVAAATRAGVRCVGLESKRQETCVSMAEKLTFAGLTMANPQHPQENHLSVPRFTHGSHCQCGLGGHHDADKAFHLGNAG